MIFGCGYLGTEIARQAGQLGLRVTVLTRNEATAAGLSAQGASTIVADLADGGWHGRIPGHADFVLNCVSSGGGGIAGYRHSYLEGMASVLAWAAERGSAGTLVYTSSTSVYPQDGGGRVDEMAPTNGDGERAQLLVETENRLRLSTDACHRWFVLRLAGIYGPARHHVIDQVRQGEIAGRGDHRLNLIHRDDICAAIWAAFAAPATVMNEVFNVADDEAAAKEEIVAWVANRLGVPTPRFTGEPAAGRRAVTPDRVIVSEKLKTALGWRPAFPTFREGYENLLSR